MTNTILILASLTGSAALTIPARTMRYALLRYARTRIWWSETLSNIVLSVTILVTAYFTLI